MVYYHIIFETRKVREKLAREANYDIKILLDNAEKTVERIEKEYGIKWKRVIRKNGKFVTMEWDNKQQAFWTLNIRMHIRVEMSQGKPGGIREKTFELPVRVGV